MSADEFVSGATVEWAGVARRIFGYTFGGAIVVLVGYVQLIGEGIVAVISAPGEFLGRFVGRLVTLPLSISDSYSAPKVELTYPPEILLQSLPFIRSTGPAAFLVGTGIALGMGFIVINGLAFAYSALAGGLT